MNVDIMRVFVPELMKQLKLLTNILTMEFKNYSNYFLIEVFLSDGKTQNFVLNDYRLSSTYCGGTQWHRRTEVLQYNLIYNIFDKYKVLQTMFTKIGCVEYEQLKNDVPSFT